MEISEKKLLLVSGTLVIAGLVVLGIAGALLQPVTYKEFLDVEDGIPTIIEGNVTRTRAAGDWTINYVATACEIPVLWNEPLNGSVRIKGKKTFYKGQPEILASKVSKP